MFRIGSVSKTLTSSLAGRLIDLGLLDIDKSVYYYLPDYPKKEWDFTVK